MRPLQLFRRWKRLIRRAHRRHGNHPAKAIYYEAIRRRFFFLGLRWGRRQAPAMTVWPAVELPVPYVPIPETLQWPNVAWSRHYYDTHPELYTSKTPLGSRKTVRLEPLPDESWLTSDKHTDPFSLAEIDTRKVLPEETEKYKAMPKFLRE